MSSFLLAFQFLTIVPLKVKDISKRRIVGSLVYFPLVGLFLGGLLLGTNEALTIFSFSPLALNTILVIVLAIITGGIHLDGLCDTADAFLSGKPKDEMLAIMRDPHIGVMGVLSLISVILLKIGLLSSLSPAVKTNALLLMCILSRWSVVLAMFLFSYAREEGKAKIFIQGINLKIFILSSILALSCAFAIWQTKGLLTLLVISGCVYLGSKFISRKLGGITGDTLGATIELAEIIVLFTVCIV
jgi:adenosylcobinamide-GDP ribazoletransferase